MPQNFGVPPYALPPTQPFAALENLEEAIPGGGGKGEQVHFLQRKIFQQLARSRSEQSATQEIKRAQRYMEKEEVRESLKCEITGNKSMEKAASKQVKHIAKVMELVMEKERVDQGSSDHIAFHLDPAAQKLALLKEIPAPGKKLTKSLQKLEKQVAQYQNAFKTRRFQELSRDTVSRFTAAYGDTLFREYERDPCSQLSLTVGAIAHYHQRLEDPTGVELSFALQALCTQVNQIRKELCQLLGRPCYNKDLATGITLPKKEGYRGKATVPWREELQQKKEKVQELESLAQPGTLPHMVALYLGTNLQRLLGELEVIAPKAHSCDPMD